MPKSQNRFDPPSDHCAHVIMLQKSRFYEHQASIGHLPAHIDYIEVLGTFQLASVDVLIPLETVINLTLAQLSKIDTKYQNCSFVCKMGSSGEPECILTPLYEILGWTNLTGFPKYEIFCKRIIVIRYFLCFFLISQHKKFEICFYFSFAFMKLKTILTSTRNFRHSL